MGVGHLGLNGKKSQEMGGFIYGVGFGKEGLLFREK